MPIFVAGNVDTRFGDCSTVAGMVISLEAPLLILVSCPVFELFSLMPSIKPSIFETFSFKSLL
jgi:hypothetical protein